jgi:heme/copper-type cytochrome/quinol oxidase subunit 1
MPAPHRRTTTGLLLAGILGAALAGAGAWLLPRPDPGWVAYAPLSGSTYDPARPDRGAVALLVGGVVLLVAAVAGLLVRRRRGPAGR